MLYSARMPATDVMPVPGRPPVPIPAIDLASLLADLAHRGDRLDEAAARHLGSAVAGTLAEAHATLDEEGDPAAVIHGRLGPEKVRIDVEGAVSVVAAVEGDTGSAPEVLQGGRLTPRADVYALGAILAPLLAASADRDLVAALATAIEPHPGRRRITCVELEAWLARGADLDAGRRSLGAAVRSCLARREQSAAASWSRPLSAPARAFVTLVTAAAVFTAGVAAVERWLR